MDLTQPISVADLYARLSQPEARFDLGEARTRSETGGGETLTAQRGVRLWRGRIVINPARAIPHEQIQAVIDLLGRPGVSFMVEHPFMRFPQADPTGANLIGAAPFVAARADDRHIFSIGGLPAWYRVTPGDHLSIAWGAGGAKRSYHRVLTGSAVTSGVAADVYVNPAIPEGVAVDDAVQVLRPALKAKMVPGSYEAPALQPGQLAGRSQFDWEQTLG